MASTKDRQRALERARYERVQQKIVKKRREQQRRRRLAIISTIAAVAVGAIAVVVGFAVTSPSSASPSAATSPTPLAKSSSPAAVPQPTAHVAGCVSPNNKTPTKMSWKAAPAMTIDQAVTYTMTIKTNCGTIVISMNAAKAPHTVNSFNFLAAQGYFNNSYCHRLTTSGIYVLQCGDPTATPTSGGTGGPGYSLPDENLTGLGAANASGTVTYPAGTVAMANSGPNTGGSQFFLVYKNSQLAPSYTPFGTITSGLNIVQNIASAGTNNSNGAGDGNPMQKVQFDSVTVTKS